MGEVMGYPWKVMVFMAHMKIVQMCVEIMWKQYT
jgi:hypothetical protein